ncbi:UvrD-helicase domain-containing protein [Treponema vincentii]|uniref:UvrD-helicase domain-containing protein n=1 Tax=Treponema vincentii TaxID=69710 RepID=UPI0035F5855F
MIVISDTTPLISFLKIKRLDLLKTLFEIVQIPKSVFANFYINDNPRMVSIFQKRFKYVFVDEMQDMHSHQIKLLDELFYTSGYTDEQ